jgi:hypothetical protein
MEMAADEGLLAVVAASSVGLHGGGCGKVQETAARREFVVFVQK